MSTLRPADILVFGWAGGKHACVDLTGVSPLVGLRDNGFVARQAALKVESSKVAKHEKACLENQHVFIPFAFDTFGFLAPEAEEFLNRILDELTEVAESSRLQDRMKLWMSISKNQRLIAELEALGERGDAVRCLNHMREIVGRDSAKLGALKQLLAGTLVGLGLKDGYVADMEEKN
ncbi:hypothetical protein Tco_1000054 [Tanacetum coccineum]